MPKRYETLEIIRQKSSMSQQVVSQKDADYGLYSGASLADAQKLALLETLKVFGISNPILTLYRSYLDQRRKAYFASVSSEITKLGFILGMKNERTTGRNTRERLNRANPAPSDKTD